MRTTWTRHGCITSSPWPLLKLLCSVPLCVDTIKCRNGDNTFKQSLLEGIHGVTQLCTRRCVKSDADLTNILSEAYKGL